jgi:hypothetical protein
MAIARYQKKISGPLLDRIDIHVEVPRVDYEKLTDKRYVEDSKTIPARVRAARCSRPITWRRRCSTGRGWRCIGNGGTSPYDRIPKPSHISFRFWKERWDDYSKRIAASIWWARSAQRYQILVSISYAWYPLGKADTSLYAELRPNCTQHHLLVKPWQ